jgi:hypothetical protein
MNKEQAVEELLNFILETQALSEEERARAQKFVKLLYHSGVIGGILNLVYGFLVLLMIAGFVATVVSS